MRLAYADPPYPGKAHLYPENTEVDHRELIARLLEYDGWALSTDETNLADVLNLCPRGVRVLAWCRSSAPPFLPYPSASWEPVICRPARIDREPVRSYCETGGGNGFLQQDGLTGQKTQAFCTWVIRCLGAEAGDTLDDLFPGTGIMGRSFESFATQLRIPIYSGRRRAGVAATNMVRRVADPLPGIEGPAYTPEGNGRH